MSGSRSVGVPFPLTLTLSLGERGQLSSRSDYSATRVVNPVAGISLKRITFLPLLGERAGVRAGVKPISLTPWLQPGVKRSQRAMNRFNGLSQGSEAVETASGFSAGNFHRAKATVLMRTDN
jgi:hypothetical protein